MLDIQNSATSESLHLDGKLELEGGTLTSEYLFTSSGSLVYGYGTLAADVIAKGRISAVAGGTLGFAAGGSFSGSLSGAGTIAFSSGSFGLESGTSVTVHGLSLSGGTLALHTDLHYAGAFTMSAGVLDLGTRALVLAGAETLTGGIVQGAGILQLKGPSTIAGPAFTIGNSSRVESLGNLGAVGNLTLNGSGTFTNAAGATYTLTGTGSADIIALSGATGRFYNFGTLAKTSNFGQSVVSAAVVNEGTIEASAHVYGLVLSGGVSGTGSIDIMDGGRLELGGAVARTQTIDFTGDGNGTLVLDAGQTFRGTVAGFLTGDTIDLAGVGDGAKARYTVNSSGTGGTLVVSNATDRAVLSLDGQFLASAFHLASDGHGGTAVTYTPPAQASTLLLAAAHA